MSSDIGEHPESIFQPNDEFVRYNKGLFSNPSRDLNFCFNVILKEAVKEDKLVRQLAYTMLSGYTNNPINLAINAPSGEGKTHVLRTVGSLFPKTDVMYIAGMTNKAIFHKNGYIAIKDEDGEYVEVEDELQHLKETLPDKKSELIKIKKNATTTTSDNITKLEKEIDNCKQRIKDIEKNVVKVIDLKHKILIFLDTPSPEIFDALMALLSHDKYEVEYQYVDTSNKSGLKTRTNILVGWPSVIFAQAIDYTRHPRYQEIQRRFIITNPRMDVEKYQNALDVILLKNCLPDLVYQQEVVSDDDKDYAREIILNIKNDLLSLSSTTKPDKNNNLIPFFHFIKKIIPKNNTAQDMTFTNRLVQHVTLIASIYSKKRPYMEIKPAFGPDNLRIPMAIYSDLYESLSVLNNYGDGVQPYVRDWYHDVFLKLYESKTKPNSQDKNGETITEQRKAVTTSELIEKTFEVMKKHYSSKSMLSGFIYPLVNVGWIDKIQSEIDRRAQVYFPVIESRGNEDYSLENSKLFLLNIKNKLFQEIKENNTNLSSFDYKTQIISQIDNVADYYSTKRNFVTLHFADDDTISVGEDEENVDKNTEEIYDKYYSEFNLDNNNNRTGDSTDFKEEHMKSPSSEEYPEINENNNNLHDNRTIDIININNKVDKSNKLFLEDNKNKLLYSCYYCDFTINMRLEYEKHVIIKHPGRMSYPDLSYIMKENLKLQGQSWEK